MKKKKKYTKVKRLTSNEVELVAQMQNDLDYLKQFVVNVPILLMGEEPAILINCSPDVEGLCERCWDECVKAAERLKEQEKLLEECNKKSEEMLT